VFEELGGAIGTTRRHQIENSIKKKFRTVSSSPDRWDDDIWQRVTSLIASEAHQVRLPQQSLSYDDLLNRHEHFIENEKRILKGREAEEPEEWIARAKRSLRNGVQDRCARRVFFQGYQWRCDTCFNTNWNDLGAIEPALVCAICGFSEPAPVDKPWNFRLNGFLQEAMREHGLLALIWCIVTLENSARETFFYLGPHELWKNYPKDDSVPPDHEADLICVVDGLVHLCEVKSSSRDIDLASLLNVAKLLRPDVVTLAVREKGSRRLIDKLKELERALDGTGIKAKLLTLQDDDHSNDVYLP
jgi:hypothetical protein